MLLFSTTGQAVRVWLGARLIYTDGEFRPLHPFGHGSKWHMVRLPAIAQDTQLTFQLCADHPYQLGLFDDFTLGSAKDQTLRLFAYDIPYVITLPVAVMIIMILIMYAFNQAAWKQLNINVIILLGMMSLWMISVSNVKQLFWDWPLFWSYVSQITMYLLPIAGNMVVYEVVERDLKPKVKWVVWAYAILALLALLAEGLDLDGLERCRVGFYPMIPVAQSLVFYCMILSMRRKNVYTRFALIPMLVLSLMGMLDGVVSYLHLFPWHVYLAPLSIYTYIAFVVFMLREQLTRERQLREHEIGLEYEIALAIERSEVDVLTNCRNRGAFEDFMRNHLSDKPEIDFSLVMMDIDCFKVVNDRFGHDAGDVVLKKFTTLIRSHLDKSHPFFRWGGEEFVIYCPDTRLSEACELAESFRQLVEQTPILPDWQVTISAGRGILAWSRRQHCEYFQAYG
jgi:diguanylate cyclase (GGDEF)-like protein